MATHEQRQEKINDVKAQLANLASMTPARLARTEDLSRDVGLGLGGFTVAGFDAVNSCHVGITLAITFTPSMFFKGTNCCGKPPSSTRTARALWGIS